MSGFDCPNCHDTGLVKDLHGYGAPCGCTIVEHDYKDTLEFCERCRSHHAGKDGCDYCNGIGVLEDPCIEGVTTPCDYCDGTGEVTVALDYAGHPAAQEPCPQCSQEEPRPITDSEVGDKPESLAERAGRLEREHAQLHMALHTLRAEVANFLPVAEDRAGLTVAYDQADNLLNRIDAREGKRG